MKECTKKDKVKTVSIIGANSYIARNLIFLLKQRRDVKIVGLYDCAPSHLDMEANYKQIDVLSKESLRRIDFSAEVIFDFVGKTGSYSGFDDYLTFINVNEIALLNILNEYRRQKSNAKLIFPSTRLIYKGKSGLLKEEDEKEFKTIYSMNKFACENYLMQYHRLFNVEYCIFRICVPYGSLINGATSYGTAEMMLSKAQEGKNVVLYGDGSARRTITYIGDLCNQLIVGALSNNCCNDVFNTGGENYSLKEMGLLIAKKYKVNVEYVDWPMDAKMIESGDTVFDDEKLRRSVSIEKQTTFKEWIETLKLKR